MLFRLRNIILLILLLSVFLPSCVFIATHVNDYNDSNLIYPVNIDKTVKININNGSIILYNDGCTITKDSIIGNGEKFNLEGIKESNVTGISRENVTSIRYYEKKWQYLSFLATIPSVALLVFISLFLISIAIYGPFRVG